MFRIKRDARGIAYVENAGFRFVICIPSRKREEVVQGCPLLPAANVIVHESEYDSYARSFHDKGATCGALLAHNLKGLPRIRNYLLHEVRDKERDEFEMQLDDEFRYLAYLMTRRAGSKMARVTDAGHQLDIFCHDALVAREMPTGAFGYALGGRPQQRRVYDPFHLRKCALGGCFGILDKELRYDENLLVHEDVDFSLQVIAKYKVMLRDDRWFAVQYAAENRAVGTPGGLSEVRCEEVTTWTARYLQSKWGKSVVDPGRSGWQGKVDGGLIIKVPEAHISSA